MPLIKAQVSSQGNYFSLSFDRACVGSEITIQFNTSQIGNLNDATMFWCFDTDVSQGQDDLNALSQLNADCFSQHTSIDPVLNFTYHDQGTYWIYWYVQREVRTYDSLKITIYEPSIPQLQYYSCNNGSLVLDTDRSADPYDLYEVNWGDGAIQTFQKDALPLIHQYQSTDIFDIQVKGLFDENDGGFNGTCANQSVANASVDLSQSFVDPARIQSTTTLSEQAVQLEFELTSDITYILQKRTNNSSFQDVTTLLNQSTFTVNNLNLETSNYTFRIILENECAGEDDLVSNLVSPVYLQPIEANENGNQLNWISNNNVNENYQIIRNDESISILNALQLLDSDVVCGVNYSYQVSVVFDNVLVVSNMASVVAIKPAESVNISHLSTEVLNENEMLISWENPPSFEPDLYYIYLSLDGSTFFLEDSVTTNEYQYNFPTDSERRYFRVNYRDNCQGETQLSPIASNILLNVNPIINTVRVNWSTYTGWNSGVEEYVLEKYSLEGDLLEEISGVGVANYVENSLEFDRQAYIYRIKAIGQNGRISYSNKALLELEPQIKVPTAFSPNDDGKNEYLNVYGKFISELELYIFNRWGNQVFYTNDPYEGWDGYFNGSPAPPGSYIYKVVVIDDLGKRHVIEGTTRLIR